MGEVSGPVRDWLAAHREELNSRFRTAQRRHAKLEPRTVLALVAEVLPPLGADAAGLPTPPSASVPGMLPPGPDPAMQRSDLLFAAYDLILLHAGRGLLSDAAPLRVLLAGTFPKLRGQLLQRPRQLPAALSNAVENLGARGGEFARGMDVLAAQLASPDQILDAGAVLAWRLGEARLREKALTVAAQLPNEATLEALGLGTWPAKSAPVAVAALRGDAWGEPRERVSPRTLEQLERMPSKKVVALLDKLAAPAAMPLSNWRRCGTCGEFAGFGGDFSCTPRLLDAGKRGGRHRFWVRSGVANYRIDADLFGWVCKPDASVDFPIQETPKSRGLLTALGLGRSGSAAVLFRDGTLRRDGESETFAELAGAESFWAGEECVAAALGDSFRIRVFAAVRPAL